MLKVIKNQKGAAHLSEYAMVIFVVVASISAMSVYIRRAVQARWRDTHKYMVDNVISEIDPYYNSDTFIYYWYDPYYTNETVEMRKSQEKTQFLRAGGRTGHFREVYNDTIMTQRQSETAPPKDAKEL